VSGRRIIPENPHPETNARFEQLLQLMAPQAVEIPEEAPEESGLESDEDCGDTQTPRDTSEDVS
jgi:hypothetical protein